MATISVETWTQHFMAALLFFRGIASTNISGCACLTGLVSKSLFAHSHRTHHYKIYFLKS
jgi:hypothetical protein